MDFEGGAATADDWKGAMKPFEDRAIVEPGGVRATTQEAKRMDLERKNHLLRLKALYLEPGIKADDELVSDVAGAMRDFMKFHQAGDLVIENSQPKAFARKILKAL